MQSSIGVTFSSKTSTESAYLVVEQEEYEVGTGVIDMLDITKLLSNLLGVTEDSAEVYCGMNSDGRSFDTQMFVYPSPEDLLYEAKVTRGTTFPSGAGAVKKTQVLNFRLDDEAQLSYPVRGVLSYKWVRDQVYDQGWNIVASPAVTFDNRSVKLSKKVYGSLEVVYTTYREAHAVTISARTDAVENFFQSVFYCRYAGGIDMKAVEPPPNAEENFAAGVSCADASYTGYKDGGTTIISPDGADPPTVSATVETVSLSYCGDFGHE